MKIKLATRNHLVEFWRSDFAEGQSLLMISLGAEEFADLFESEVTASADLCFMSKLRSIVGTINNAKKTAIFHQEKMSDNLYILDHGIEVKL
jgi:hypothetical protein